MLRTFSLLLLCISQTLQAQHLDLTGEWQGVLTQPNVGENNPLSNSYTFSLTLTQLGDSVVGYSRIEIPGTPYFGVIKLAGKVDGSRFDYVETVIWEELISGGYWCIKRGTLYYHKRKDLLRGVWEATYRCGPGEIVVYRVPPV